MVMVVVVSAVTDVKPWPIEPRRKRSRHFLLAPKRLLLLISLKDSFFALPPTQNFSPFGDFFGAEKRLMIQRANSSIFVSLSNISSFFS